MSTLTINKSWEFVHSLRQPIKIIEVHILVSRTTYSTLQLFGGGGNTDPNLVLFLLSVEIILATLTFKLESLTESSTQSPFTTFEESCLPPKDILTFGCAQKIHHKGELLK
jgi:hypothetical protein